MTKIIDAILDFNNPLNFIAFVFLIILTGIALIGTFSKNSKKLKHYARQSPAILATVGIFFSFLGISIGLIGLDLKDIQNSIPNLLDGLKVKFIASLMGIFFSIIVRVAQSFTLEQDENNQDTEQQIINLLSDIKKALADSNKNTPEQLLKELKESIAILPTEFKKQSILLESIKSSLAGDGDASVTTQLLKVRETLREGLDTQDKKSKQYFDELNNNNKQYLSIVNKTIREGFDSQKNVLIENFEKLTKQFDEFARVLAENNSKAFIEALEKAMRDFNNNITEQFGENFKELNRAVGELLKWQDKYKTHVEQLTDNFNIALKSVQTIETSFNTIQNRSEHFITVSETLNTILISLDRQLNDLTNHLNAFDELANNAKGAFPIIEKNIKDLTTGFKTSTEQSLNDINGTVKDMRDNLVSAIDKLKDTTNKMRDAMEDQKDTLDKTSIDFKQVIDTTLKKLAKDTQTSIDEYRDALQNTVSEQLRIIENSVKQSNSSINTAVEKASNTFEQSINSTGDKLTNTTESLKSIISKQEQALITASDKFEAVVSNTLSNLSRETQNSLDNYQNVLNSMITTQSNKIHQAIENAGNEFERSIKTTAKQFDDMANSINTSVKIQETLLIGVSDNFKTTINQTLQDLSVQSKTTIKKHEEELQKMVQEQMNHISNAVKSSSEQFNKLLTENTTKSTSVLEQQVKLLDTALQNELKTAIETMGKHLAALSNKFVQDYNPLTDKLRDVVRMAERLDRGRN